MKRLGVLYVPAYQTIFMVSGQDLHVTHVTLDMEILSVGKYVLDLMVTISTLSVMGMELACLEAKRIVTENVCFNKQIVCVDRTISMRTVIQHQHDLLCMCVSPGPFLI